MLDGEFNNGAELAVLLLAKADVAGVDAVLVQRLRAIGIVRQQLVADVVKISDQRSQDSPRQQLFLDARHRGSGVGAVHGDANNFRSRQRQSGHLIDGPLNVRRVGVRHRLHDDGRVAANDHGAWPFTHAHADCAMARFWRGVGNQCVVEGHGVDGIHAQYLS